jgi:hypothetical protein
VEVAQPPSGKEGHLERAQELDASQARARGVERGAPAAELLRRARGELPLDRAASMRIEWRLLEEWREERAKIEARAADDERHSSASPRIIEPRHRRTGPGGGGVALGGLGDVDAGVHDALALGGTRLCGADVEAPIDLP